MSSVEPIDLDRRYISQFTPEMVGLNIASRTTGAPLDPDGSLVTATYFDDEAALIVRTTVATRLEVGKYAIALNMDDVTVPGLYSVVFDYDVAGVADRARVSLQVGEPAPAYDALPPGMKEIVESVWVRFADLYDSPHGGPHLQTYVASKFGRNRMAQLLGHAIGRLNIISQPYMTYNLDKEFPFAKWGSLLEMALYIEVIKHLVRTYVEQPEILLGTNVSRLDRRDYMNRWSSMLQIEEEDFKRMTSSFKMANMGLGNGRALVSGGVFGRWGNVGWGATSGGAAARGYFSASRAY